MKTNCIKSLPKSCNFRKLTTNFFLTFSLFLIADTITGQELMRPQKTGPVSTATLNFKVISDLEATLQKPEGIARISYIPNEETEDKEPENLPISPYISSSTVLNRITVSSPAPSLNYEAAPDEAKGGGLSGSYTIPPDTHGAVGLDKVFITLNNNYKILNKSTGAQLSLVSMNTFWTSLGSAGTSPFDPRTLYDPYNNRWILTAVSNGGVDASRLLVAISKTHDPEGAYDLFAFDPDSGATLWADYPTIGFNKNWVAISLNMFPIAAAAQERRVLVIDYPTLLTGTANATFFTGITSQSTLHFAETFSSTENTLYGVSHVGSASATYRFNSITGTPASPVLTLGVSSIVRTGGGWTQPSGNLAPQTCVVSCPGTLQFMDVGDSRISGNVIFRNNALWYTQTVGLPTGAATRMGVQWTKLNTSGAFLDGGRIEVPTATNANGEQWYTYPSLSVNINDDVLVGMTKTESDGYAGAAYAFRYGTDAVGIMQDPVIYKDGEDYYDKTSSGRTRWGDYSHTMVDPLNDASFWTIQEYAKLRAAPSVFSTTAKWGTWVAKVDPNACLSNVTSGNWNTSGTWGCASVPDASKHVTIIAGQNVTLDINPLAASITVNEGGTLTVNASRTLSCKLIVYGTLNISGGKLILGSNDVFISSGATLTGASPTSYFVTNGSGKVSKIIEGGSSFEFPVSSNGISYNGLTVALAPADPAEVFTIGIETGLNPATSGASNCVQRTWSINEMKIGENNATLTFKWSAAEHGAGFNPAIPPYAFRHNGATYGLASNLSLPVLSSGIYSSSTTGPVSSFSPWIVSSTSTLPITLHYFTGTKLSNGSHLLDWKATCSGASASFDVERSDDGRNYITINSVSGDFLRCQQPFALTDDSPLKGKNFYRIKMTDEYGKIKYSPIVLLLNSKSGFEIVAVQPNPVRSSAILNISVAKKQAMKLSIIDIKGSIVYQNTINVSSGSHQEEINMSTFHAGTYSIRLVSEAGELRTIRFVKQ